MPTIRKARLEDADTLTRITMAAKGFWGYPAHWMDQWADLLKITATYIENNEAYIAIDPEGAAIGWYALGGSGQRLVLDHLWVRPDHIGRGIGRALFTHALSRAVDFGAEFVELEADPHAAGFYERMGAQRIGERDASMDGLERRLPIFRIRVTPAH